MEEESQNSQTPQASPYVIPVAIIVAGVLIAGALMSSGNKTPLAKAPSVPDVSENRARFPLAVKTDNKDAEALLWVREGDYVLGNPDAPVTIAEFGDFQCPFCEKFHNGARKEIVEKYVKSGQVKLIWRHFPLETIHPYAKPASIASECAGEQGKFWEYHTTLFSNQNALAKDNLIQYAGDLGLNTVAFESCLVSGKYDQKVQSEFNLGRLLNISGTPTYFINGLFMEGALPFKEIESVILEVLKNI
ncbi:MAG: hypothetical protein COU46_03195 [Candidatus Niyogibacteria bacterium CG10_big_fil_rev_8_21_14_0_10_42_19]|uniref:Thioredoxin domain-containing protein n=1 Tax=Candidatus Niyogibacteria bacterium CG10_big_fil_rev_8_21_14_0_10_42_19 TaxID=1974725 RepID=A0A2H0TF06_9BACT|nr:MAG: hypothetical protein COU46_03195 [Candidatus Niyogibacteria bacterium CG10_big_fil_rev_8_21_14_0_10_42_19]